jgi:epoxyqueuosine reductase
VLIAAGNSGDRRLLPQATALLRDASPLVRAMAVWAVHELWRDDPAALAALRAAHLPDEADEAVRAEWLNEVAIP